MAFIMSDMIGLVRNLLGDNEPGCQVFSDEQLCGHITHALEVYSGYLPVMVVMEAETVAGQAVIELGECQDGDRVLRVEYPAGQLPPCYRRFRQAGQTVVLEDPPLPDGGPAFIYCGRLHFLDEEGTSLPAGHLSLVARGAAGLCALSEAVRCVNRINAGGSAVSRDYNAWGEAVYEGFIRALRALAGKKRVEASRLYRAG